HGAAVLADRAVTTSSRRGSCVRRPSPTAPKRVGQSRESLHHGGTLERLRRSRASSGAPVTVYAGLDAACKHDTAGGWRPGRGGTHLEGLAGRPAGLRADGEGVPPRAARARPVRAGACRSLSTPPEHHDVKGGQGADRRVSADVGQHHADGGLFLTCSRAVTCGSTPPTT